MHSTSRLSLKVAWLLIGGLVMGGLLGGMAAWWLSDYLDDAEDDPGTTTTTCEGADVSLTVSRGPGEANDAVLTHVVLSDPQFREWALTWPSWERGVEQVTLDRAEPVWQRAEAMGDVDDGDERTLSVRPSGARSWCAVTASLQ